MCLIFKEGNIPFPWAARESATDFNRNPGSDSTTGQGSHVCPPTQSSNNGQLSLYRVGQAIPRIHQGDDVEIAPGDYAAFVFTLPFGKARKDNGLYRSERIEILHNLEPKRELLIREKRDFTGAKFAEKIGSKVYNIEAALLQITGERPAQPCVDCQRGNGPFGLCIVSSVSSEKLTACGNCHWNGEDTRCDFWQGVGIRQSMGRRRRASSSSPGLELTTLHNINVRAPPVESSTAIISRAIAKLNECMTAYSQEKLQTDAAFNGNATTIMKLLADPHPNLNDLLAHGFPARASSTLDQKHNELRAILAELLAHGRNQPATR